MYILPVKGAYMNYRELEKILKANGWFFLRTGKGSHMLWSHDKAVVPIPIPNHGSKELNPALTKGLLKKIEGVNK
jgi:predicted RNA binding protein YcfA (HicA-like mRNA interferase family)